MFHWNDLGIIVAKKGTPGASTYLDRYNLTQSYSSLTGSYTAHSVSLVGTRDSAKPYVGRPIGFSVWVTVTLDGSPSVSVKLQNRYCSTDPWADVQSVREDTGDTNAEHTFTADGTYLVQSSSLFSGLDMQIVSKAAAAIGANTEVVCKARAGY